MLIKCDVEKANISWENTCIPDSWKKIQPNSGSLPPQRNFWLESSEASCDISLWRKEAQNLEHLSELWRQLILEVEYEAYHLQSAL